MKNTIAIATLCIAASTASHAHITLEQQTAVAGATYKAVFRVGHGCDGSPTTRLTVFLPDRVLAAKPMPKAPWKLDVVSEKLAQPYTQYGEQISTRTSQVSWSGGRLLDSEYDEFIINTTLPKTVGPLYFRVLQECEKGKSDWADIPVDGQPRPARPAARLDVQAAPAAAGAGMPAEHHH